MKMYNCLMQPDVPSDKPGKGSKCGMDLKGMPSFSYASMKNVSDMNDTISLANDLYAVRIKG